MPYPSAHGPPGIPPLGTHSLFGTQLPYSPDGAIHCPCPHVTTVNSDRTENENSWILTYKITKIYYIRKSESSQFKNGINTSKAKLKVTVVRLLYSLNHSNRDFDLLTSFTWCKSPTRSEQTSLGSFISVIYFCFTCEGRR